MFHRLLVPLDGSRLAECVLPVVQRSAELFECVITLLHVIEKKAPSSIHGDTHLRDSVEAERYLANIEVRSFCNALPRNSAFGLKLLRNRLSPCRQSVHAGVPPAPAAQE